MAKKSASPSPLELATKAANEARQEAHKLREANRKTYDATSVEPTEVDGRVFRSRLEALWYEEFKDCESFDCFECSLVPVWIEGPFGKFLSNYKPDLSIILKDGTKVFVELKPNHELAMADDRQKRALELNPRYRFVVIGGYPYQSRGVTVRMLTGKQELVHQKVQVCEVLKFMECNCK